MYLRLETTKLLLKYGANYNAVSRYGDDALQMACLKGATRIFEYLTLNVSYTPEQLANAHELMGATFLDEHNDLSICLNHWKQALKIRQQNGKYSLVLLKFRCLKVLLLAAQFWFGLNLLFFFNNYDLVVSTLYHFIRKHVASYIGSTKTLQ